MSGAVGITTGKEVIPDLVEGLSGTGCGSASESDDMARLLGSAVCAHPWVKKKAP